MYKEFCFVNYNTLLHVSTLLGHLQGETFRYRYTMSRLVQAETTKSSRLHKRRSAVNSTFSLNCIVQPSVTTTESFSLKMTQQGRNM
jgi:hypothetical protein